MNEMVSADGTRGRKRRLEPNNQGHEISSNYSSNNATPLPKFPSLPLGQPSRSASGKDRSDDGSDPYCGDDDLFDIADLPNDTMATVMCLQQEFYKGQGNRPEGSASEDGRSGGGGERTGVILQHQIYTILANRTAVDRELTAMRKDNVLRTFRLNTGREDWGLMSTEHYLRLIHNVFGKTQIEVGTKGLQNFRRDLGGSSRDSNRGAPPAGKVLEHLVRTIARAYASRKEVSSAMGQVSLESGSRQGGDGEPSRSQEGNGAVYSAVARGADGQRGLLGNGKSLADGKKRKYVRVQEQEEEEQGLASLKQNEENVLAIASELIRAGFLLPRRDVGREEAYWFSLPQLGKVTASITRGRKEITRALKRTRYKEMRRSALEAKNPARSTGLPISFHIRDLLGLGIIKQLDTPSGAFLRIVHDADA